MVSEGFALPLGRHGARLRSLLCSTALRAPIALAVLLASPAAFAACDQVGSTVTCTGTTTNYDAGAGGLNATVFTVQSGASVTGAGGNRAITVNPATSIDLTNFGTIDGGVVLIGTGNTFTNFGLLRNTDPAGFGLGYTINGNFEQKSSGSMSLRFDTGFFDQMFVIALGANARLAGSLILVPQPAIYTLPVTYDFVAVIGGGSVIGTFSSVRSSSPFFSVSSDYSSGTTATFTLTPIAFNAAPGLTPNQKAVADTLQTNFTGALSTNATTLYSNLFAASSISVFDQLSGAGTSAAQGASFTAGNLFNTAMLQQGIGWLNGTPGGGNITIGGPLQYAAAAKPASKPGYEAFAAMHPRVSEPGRWRAWGTGFGGSRSVNGEASTGSADQSQHTAGGAFGVDHQIDADLLLGFAAGGSGSTFSVSSLSTSGRVDGGHVGVYAVKSFGAAYMAAMLSYARLDNKIDRTISGVGPTENATGRFASDQLSGRLELGWQRKFDGYAITPFVALEPAALWQHAYSETSTVAGGGTGVLGLNYRSNTVTSLPTFLGAQLDTRYVLAGGQTLSPFARAAWVHEFEPDRKIQASFISVPSTAFTVDGARASPNAVRIDTGATLALNRATALFANFNSEISRRSRSYAGMAGARVNW